MAVKVPPLLHKMSLTSQRAWYNKNAPDQMPPHLTTSVAKSKSANTAAQREKAKKAAAQGLQAYGATRGTATGGEGGNADAAPRDTIAPLTPEQHAKKDAEARKAAAAAKAAKPVREKKPKAEPKAEPKPAEKKPLTTAQRIALIAAAAKKARSAAGKAKAAAKFDVPTEDPDDAGHDDFMDQHYGMHQYSEEVEQIDEGKTGFTVSHPRNPNLKYNPKTKQVWHKKSGEVAKDYGNEFAWHREKHGVREEVEQIQESDHPAVIAHASQAHEDWRKGFEAREGKGAKRVKKNSDGSEGDINVPFHKLHPDQQRHNLVAARVAHEAVKRHGNDIEAASEHVHNEWMKSNPKTDDNAHQHVPYKDLPEHEKQKDRDRVTLMHSLLKTHKEETQMDDISEGKMGQLHADLVRQAKGIAFGKRYKEGNMTGAYKAIQALGKKHGMENLADHPEVSSALQRANEEVELEEGQVKDANKAKKNAYVAGLIRNKYPTALGSKKYGRRALKQEEVEQIDEVGDAKVINKIKKNNTARKIGSRTSKIGSDAASSRVYALQRGREILRGRMGEEVEQIEEARVNHRDFATDGVMHPSMANASYMKQGSRADFYSSKTGNKLTNGEVIKNDGKHVHIRHDGDVHKFRVSETAPHQMQSEEVENIEEKLKVSQGASKWIKDFVKSEDPRFAGDSQAQRINRALGAYYKAKRQVKEETEELDDAEGSTPTTPKQKELAAHHGDPKKITYGDVVKARIKSARGK